jgi:cell division protein FtsI/penicillin-binding protein 2
VRIVDHTQNLPARIRTVQILALALMGICVVRLYNLQIGHSDYYHERAINQRLRTVAIPAPRGTILDLTSSCEGLC